MAYNFISKNAIYPDKRKIPAILKQADEADVKARDVRPLKYIIKQMISNNTRISGNLKTRRDAFASFDFTIKDAPEDVKPRLEKIIRQMYEGYSYAVAFGDFAAKIVWEYSEESGLIEAKLKLIDPLLIDFEGENLLIRESVDSADAQIIEPNNPDYVWHVYDKSFRGGVLRSVIIPEILRHKTVIEWDDLNDRLKGMITAITNPEKLQVAAGLVGDSSTEKQLENTRAAIANPDGKTYLNVLDHTQVGFAQLADAAAGVSYLNYINKLDRDIAIAIVGNANTTDLPNSGGSRAAVQIQAFIQRDILYSDMLNVQTLAQRIIDLDYQKNNDTTRSKPAPYKFNWIYDDVTDTVAFANTLDTVATRIAPTVKGGFAVDTQDMYAKLNLAIPKGANLPDITYLGAQSPNSNLSGLPIAEPF